MFGIWHPVYQGSKRDKCRQFEYTNRINFTCNHDIDMYVERKEAKNDQRTNSLKKQCDKIDSRTFKNPKDDVVVIPTEQRCEYRWQTPPLKIDKNIPDIAYGIVPDAFGWSRFPPIERKRSVMNR